MAIHRQLAPGVGGISVLPRLRPEMQDVRVKQGGWGGRSDHIKTQQSIMGDGSYLGKGSTDVEREGTCSAGLNSEISAKTDAKLSTSAP